MNTYEDDDNREESGGWSDEEAFRLDQLFEKVKELPIDSQIKVLGNFLGYRTIPPTIEQFINGEYYLQEVTRDLFPFWLDKLKMIYPTPIHTRYPIVIFKGGIGTGKSTAAKIMAEYMKCRIMCLIDPYKTFKLMPGKNIKFAFFHKSSDLARTDFLQTIDMWEGVSPYFREMRESGKMKNIQQVPESTRSNTTIGSDVIFYNFSELNFIPYKQAFAKLDGGFKRWDSRFRLVRPYFGNIVVDTSSTEDDSIAEDFANNNPFGDQVLVINTNQWVVREHLGFYGKKGWFKVYLGDSIHSPFIIDDDHPLTDDMDHERTIDVPEELRDNFRMNLERSLQEMAGISTTSSDKLFVNTSNLDKDFTLPQYSKDVVKFDFYDRMDKLIYRFSRSIDSIPEDKVLYVRYDIGISGDNTGLAIAYFDSWKTYDLSKNLKQPKIIVPLAVGINRYEGSETPIAHLYEFIMDLNERFEVGGFSADQFGSAQLIQDLKREGLKARKLSVDKTDEAYIYFKTLANNGLISLPDNKLLRKEFKELKRIGGKVDHPKDGCFVGGTMVNVLHRKSGTIMLKPLMSLFRMYEEFMVLNFTDGKFGYVDIKKVCPTKTERNMMKVSFGDKRDFYCTKDHKFLTNIGYVEAKDLSRKYFIINGGGDNQLSIDKVEEINMNTPVPVYDLEVGFGDPNFCIGTDKIVVHNSKDIADAVSGCVFDLYQNIDKAGQLSTKNKVRSYMNLPTDQIYNPMDRASEVYSRLW